MPNHVSLWNNFFVDEYRVPKYKGTCSLVEESEEEKDEKEEGVDIIDVFKDEDDGDDNNDSNIES